jgi:3-deoxy-manno-octulosonate cytidylyltransferase (CMP-KDO synthetase)
MIIVIPARLNSKRLPNKVLLDYNGKPLIWHAINIAMQSSARRIYIAVEKEETSKLMNTILGFKFDPDRIKPVYVYDNTSGTQGISKLMNVSTQIIPHDEVVVNLQADEPLFPANLLEEIAKDDFKDVKTIAVPSNSSYSDNTVKVTIDHFNNALYFSRSHIPFGTTESLKHVGCYAFHRHFFDKYSDLKPTKYPSERLEQLQWLENGYQIKVIVKDDFKNQSIDSEEDYRKLLTIEDKLSREEKPIIVDSPLSDGYKISDVAYIDRWANRLENMIIRQKFKDVWIDE